MVYPTSQGADTCVHRKVQPQIQMLKDTSTHGGARNLDLWNPERTEALLKLVKENYHRFQNKSTKYNTVWEEICQKMQAEQMPGVTREQVKDKFKNLKVRYLKYVDKRNEGRILPPQCFDSLDAILGNCTSTFPGQRMSTGGVKSPAQPEPSRTQPLGGMSNPNQTHSKPIISRVPKIEVPVSVSPVMPNHEPNDEFPEDVSDLLQINMADESPNKRRRLEGRRRVRTYSHGKVMEKQAREYVQEVKRHNAAMERMMRELVDAQKQIAEEYKKRSHLPPPPPTLAPTIGEPDDQDLDSNSSPTTSS